MKSKLAVFLIAAGVLFAQPPVPINPGTSVSSAVVNANFSGLYTGRVGRWSGAGVPGDLPFSIIGDLYFNTSVTGSVYGCYQLHCTAVGANNWVLVSGTNGVTSVVNDTNVTGSIAGTVLTLGWTSTLAKSRIINTAVYNDQLNTYSTGLQHFGAAQVLAPVGTSNPGTCTIGQIFFRSDFTAGQNWSLCTALNTWTQQLNSGGISGLTTNRITKAASSTTIANSSISDDGTTVTITEPVAIGSSPPAITGTGILGLGETTGQACVAGADCLQADSTSHRLLLKNNSNTSSGAVLADASTDTLTNKTFDTAGAGNSLKVAGTSITAVSGTGAVCLASGSACAGGSGIVLQATVSITSAQIKTLHASPITLVAAQGAGTFIEFISGTVEFVCSGCTQYTAGGNTGFAYGSSASNASNLITSGNFDAISTTVQLLFQQNGNSGGAVNWGDFRNTALTFSNVQATEYATGTGTLIVHCDYVVHSGF